MQDRATLILHDVADRFTFNPEEAASICSAFQETALMARADVFPPNLPRLPSARADCFFIKRSFHVTEREKSCGTRRRAAFDGEMDDLN